jgi:hypothetical protein
MMATILVVHLLVLSLHLFGNNIISKAFDINMLNFFIS